MLKNIVTFRNAYVLGLIGLLVGLSISVVVISISQMFLGLVWLLEGKFREKMRRLYKCRPFWVLAVVFGLHLLGLIHTTDFEYALTDLRIKVPLLIIPFIICSQPTLKPKELSILYLFFITGLLVSISASVAMYFDLSEVNRLDGRNASIFVSHIRLSLMLCISILAALYIWKVSTVSKGLKVVIGVISAIFLIYMVYFQYVTGLALLFVSLMLGDIAGLFQFKSAWIRYGLRGFYTVCVLGLITLFVQEGSSFLYPHEVSVPTAPTYTPDGGVYTFDPSNKQLENGYAVGQFLCEFELVPIWQERSKIAYKEKGNTGEYIRATLIRYLTSKGLNKDGESLRGLSNEEILSIENGVTNYRFGSGNSPRKRVYETLWEFHNYLVNEDNPSGNSLVMRIEFWKAAFYSIQNNLFLGVGTGDIKVELGKAYLSINTKLDKEYWYKPHNQYLSIAVCFGILGLIVFLYCLLVAFNEAKPSGLAFLILFVLCASMLTEDTIERQVGVTLFAIGISIIPSLVNLARFKE